jgi:hypothetical protein
MAHNGAEGAQRSSDARRREAAQYAMRGLSAPAEDKDAWSRPKEGGGTLVEGQKKLVSASAGGCARLRPSSACALRCIARSVAHAP